MSNVHNLIDATALTADAERRGQAAVAETAEAVRSALADGKQPDRALLTKVAGRLRSIPPAIETDAQLEILLAVCRHFLTRDQDLAFAMEAAAGVIRVARSTGRKQELHTGLLMQGFVASQLDNHVEALESVAAAREVAVEMGSPLAELKAVANGAAFLLNVGRYQDALGLLRNALTIIDRCEENEGIAWTVLGNIAQCYFLLHEYEEALQLIAAARAVLTEPTDAHAAGNRTILEYVHLRTLVALKRGAEAKPMLEAMGRYAAQAGTVRARIDYTCARGMLEVVDGKRDVGLSRIFAAREKAKLVTSTLPDVLSAMIAAQDALGEAAAAQKFRGELSRVLAQRQETSRLRAALLVESAPGTRAGVEHGVDYEQRLEAARERLLRTDPI